MKKIIATGKGGAGKTTIVATLSRLMARQGIRVMVIDTDPSMNLTMSLGVPFSQIHTLAEDKREIQERLYDDVIDEGSKRHSHSWNINIDIFLEKYMVVAKDDVKVVVMGTISEGGGGCICSYISIVKRLIDYLALWSDQYDVIIVDSQAGSEILGRGLAVNYDHNLIITESFPKSIEVAKHVLKLARDLHIKNQLIVVNKVIEGSEMDMVAGEMNLKGESTYPVRYDDMVIEADRQGSLILDMAPGSPVIKDIRAIMDTIVSDYKRK